jgi:pyruvate dehydrogenase E1 component alpha subunit
MHLADFAVGSLGESGIVGGAIPVATGAGLSIAVKGEDRVCLCCFGDGAANEGVFHESLNLASVWKLPVVYLCENNGYACTVPAAVSTSVTDIAQRAAAYDMPGAVVDGQDAIAVHAVVAEAAERARRGEGPTLVEAKTYRFREHAEGMSLTIDAPYRAEEEVAAWISRDPITILRDLLVTSGVLDEQAADDVEEYAAAAASSASRFALDSAAPDPSAAFDDLYAAPIPDRPGYRPKRVAS